MKLFSIHRPGVFCVCLVAALAMCAGRAPGYPVIPSDRQIAPDRVISGHTEAVHSLAFLPDGTRFVSGSRDGTACLWELKTGRLIHTFKGNEGPIFAVAVSEDGKRIATGGADHTIRIWDAGTYEQVGQLEGHTGDVRGIAFLSDGRLVSGAGDGVRIWDLAAEKTIWKWEGHSRISVSAMSLSKDQRRLAVMDGFVGSCVVLDLAAKKEIATIGDRTVLAPWVTISPDGNSIFCEDGGSTRAISLFQIDGVKKLPVPTDWLYYRARSVLFTPDGKRLIIGGDDKGVAIWDMETRQVKQVMLYPPKLPQGGSLPDSLALSSDGKTLLVGGGGRTSAHEWLPTPENPIIVYTLNDERIKPPTGLADGSVSWEEIPCRIKTLEGKFVLYQDWREKPTAAYVISKPAMRRMTEGLDAWLTTKGILFHRGGGVLEEVLIDPDAMFCDVACDGKYVWAASLRNGVYVLDRSGKTVEQLLALPPCNQFLRLYPLEPGKMLAVGASGSQPRELLDSWCGIFQLQPQGGVSVHVFFKTSEQPAGWFQGTSNDAGPAPAKPPAFAPPLVLRATRGCRRDRQDDLDRAQSGTGMRLLAVDPARQTVQVTGLPHTRQDPAKPIPSPNQPPVWVGDRQCLFGSMPVLRAELTGPSTFGTAHLELNPDWSTFASNMPLKWGDRYVLPGERWYAIDAKTLHASDLGLGLRTPRGSLMSNVNCFVSGTIGLAAFDGNTQLLYRISVDPEKPLPIHATSNFSPTIVFNPTATPQVIIRKDDVLFVGGDYLMQFNILDAQMCGNIWLQEFARADAAAAEDFERFKPLVWRLQNSDEERDRVGISEAQLQRLQKIVIPPREDLFEVSAARRKELEAMFKTWRDAPLGEARDRAAKPFLDIVSAESKVRAQRHAEFKQQVEACLTPGQMLVLQYKSDPSN